MIIYGSIYINGLENIDRENFYEIESKILDTLVNNYGDPQEKKIRDDGNGYSNVKWYFKNNCTIRLYSYYRQDEFSYIEILYINNERVEEKE